MSKTDMFIEDPTMVGDSTLLERARRGDEQAIHQLMTICRADVRRIAFSECDNPSDAEDAAQESLLVMHRRIGALRTLQAFPSWIFVVIRHECRRLMRRQRRWGELDEVSEPGETTAHDSSNTNLDVASAIAALDALDRQLVIHCHIEKCRVDESAIKLGLSTAAAKSRLQRARQVLRRYLHDYSSHAVQ
ncbi:RNA polymerase sigma factor [Salinicola sp. JS01]|uniref:RNA polymerase sigma factor n=1 Tax=Salinicola sp. JS01 TaxID=3050071 RepID=UPI00255B5B90|nr:RNA polymerase sigma factor [Salinicola sp. JS01]WIX32612.1 RNA polymerase sigma factor [Salinicola sp. JS01]